MTIKTLPGAPEGRLCAGISSPIQPRALDRWNPGIRAARDTADDRNIGIYDVIGRDDFTGEGVTSKRISAALRAIGAGPVTVNINSPGGDVFEGLAIYNLLREHKGEVSVNVVGVAASAASIIAMAGDTVQIARAGFLMIHNAWVVAMGNRNDLRDYADTLEPFDRAMAEIYAARTGQDAKAMSKLMDKETWISGAEAIAEGFADDLLPSDQVEQTAVKAVASAVRRIEAALRAAGHAKSDAVQMISELKADARISARAQVRPSAEADSGRVALNELESTFLEEMIPHHEMAIEMARELFPSIESPEVKGLVEGIIAAQAGEIALMQTWLDSDSGPSARKDRKKKKKMPMKMSEESNGGAGEPAASGEGDPTGNGREANPETAALAALKSFT